MINFAPSRMPYIDKGLRIFVNIQDPDEYRAAHTAMRFRDYMGQNHKRLSDFSCGFRPDSGEWQYMETLYLNLMKDAAARAAISQDAREQALEAAEQALEHALSRFTQVKQAVGFMDTVYRQQSEYTLKNAVGRNLKNRYKETVKEFLKSRRECLRANKRFEYAAKQVWKRDPDACPGDGWVWVRTHKRKSRMGKDYVVDGYWRAPRNLKTTTNEPAELTLLKQPEDVPQVDPGREPRKRRLPFGVRELIPRVQDALNRSSTFPSAANMLNAEGVLTSQGRKWTLVNFCRFCMKYDLKRAV